MKKQWQGFFFGILTAFLLIGLLGTALAVGYQKQATLTYDGIKITLDGAAIVPTDANGNAIEPFAIDGTNYLPVRGIANALGLGVDWDGATKTVKLTTAKAPGTSSGEVIDGNLQVMEEVYFEAIKLGGKYYRYSLAQLGNSPDSYSLHKSPDGKYYTSTNYMHTASLLKILDGDYFIYENTDKNPNIAGVITAFKSSDDFTSCYNYKDTNSVEYRGLDEIDIYTYNITYPISASYSQSYYYKDGYTLRSSNPKDVIFTGITTFGPLTSETSFVNLPYLCQSAGIKEPNIHFDETLQVNILDLD